MANSRGPCPHCSNIDTVLLLAVLTTSTECQAALTTWSNRMNSHAEAASLQFQLAIRSYGYYFLLQHMVLDDEPAGIEAAVAATAT